MGISITDHGTGHDWQSSSANGYLFYVSKGGSGAMHNPSPSMTVSQINTAIGNARTSQPAFASGLPTAVKTWYDALSSSEASGVWKSAKFAHKLDADDTPPTP